MKRNTLVAIVVSGSIGSGLGSLALGQIRHNDVADRQRVETAARVSAEKSLTDALNTDVGRICDAVRGDRQVLVDIIATFTPPDLSVLSPKDRMLLESIIAIAHRPIICGGGHP